MMIEPKVLKGFRDALPEQEIKRKKLIRELEDTFELSGFVPIDTPALEYTEVLLGKGSGETDKQMYRFFDNGKRDVALRFDLTIPFARFIAKHSHELYIPFKRYHIAKVWRGENTQKGRYREFFQCDFDIVGIDSTSSDLEVLLLMHRSLASIGAECTININHRSIFNDMLKKLDVSKNSVEILRTVDKLAKIGRNEVLTLLTELSDAEKAETILDFIQAEDCFEKTLAKMEKLSEIDGQTSEGILRIKEIYVALQAMGIENDFELNPSITRGLDYYTGLVYETFLKELPGIGSVCSGGRYNDLAGIYTKEKLPGVGASIGLDRLLAGMEEIDSAARTNRPVSVLIMMLDNELIGYYHKLAGKLRDAGISCEVFPENKKFKNQFRLAEQKNIPLALICGSDEKNAGTVTLKNLDRRENIDGVTEKTLIETVKTQLEV